MPVPVRTCVGCRTRRPQTELWRCAVTADGRATVDRRAPGRGAWLCPPPGDCFEGAVRRRGFERAFRRPTPDLGAVGARWQVAAGEEIPAETRRDA